MHQWTLNLQRFSWFKRHLNSSLKIRMENAKLTWQHSSILFPTFAMVLPSTWFVPLWITCLTLTCLEWMIFSVLFLSSHSTNNFTWFLPYLCSLSPLCVKHVGFYLNVQHIVCAPDLQWDIVHLCITVRLKFCHSSCLAFSVLSNMLPTKWYIASALAWSYFVSKL